MKRKTFILEIKIKHNNGKKLIPTAEQKEEIDELFQRTSDELADILTPSTTITIPIKL